MRPPSANPKSPIQNPKSHPSRRPRLWLFLSELDRPGVELAMASVAWMADAAGAAFECYLEAGRDGRLFAKTGSTVPGGAHHQQFNYLHAGYDVEYIVFGAPSVFRSSMAFFGRPTRVETGSFVTLYQSLIEHVVNRESAPEEVPDIVVAPAAPVRTPQGGELDLGPYLYPEIYFRRALAFPADAAAEFAASPLRRAEQTVQTLFTDPETEASLRQCGLRVAALDRLLPEDEYGTVSMRIARRWAARAKGVAFGDPAIIRAMLPTWCRERRVAVYAPKKPVARQDVVHSSYAESASAVSAGVIELSRTTGNPVLTGRQTCDGDLFAWGRAGISIQIADPNRPAFPVVAARVQPWAAPPDGRGWADGEPDDAQLERWAAEGKVLATLLWHSGEMAHNEAMLNVFELAAMTGLKMGVGVHLARYETCPQSFELLAVAREQGGMRGLIEPVLHAGGLGVMAEVECPPDKLEAHCRRALEGIRRIAGAAGSPRGYYAFCDAHFPEMRPAGAELYAAVQSAGLEYFVSSARPGVNRVLRLCGEMPVLNQSCRCLCSGSPFVRVTTREDIEETSAPARPGWMIATLDSPVIAFTPYIWRHGSRFMQLAGWFRDRSDVVNVLPHTVARYARLLARQGLLPPPEPDVACGAAGNGRTENATAQRRAV